MSLPPGVVRTPDICFNKPRLAGTRWYTGIVIGWDYDRVALLAGYPHLTEAQIDTAIRFEQTPRRRLGRRIVRLRRWLAAWLLGMTVAELEEEGL